MMQKKRDFDTIKSSMFYQRSLAISIIVFAIVLLFLRQNVYAQGVNLKELLSEASSAAGFASGSAQVATVSAEDQQKIEELKKQDVTQPEEVDEKSEVFALFAKRLATTPSLTNFIAYAIQYSVKQGVPANTIFVVLVVPILASIIAFVRHILGLPSIGLLVPIALSITLVSTGITAGMVLLLAILLASTFSKIILKRLRIMQLPKMALSIFIVAIFIIATLTISASLGVLTVRTLSIFPVLLLVLLSDRIVTLQIERSLEETLLITTVTLLLGILGFFLLTADFLKELILVYPEILFLLIPINIIVGRYFGLRVSEYIRFSPIKQHGSK